MTKDELKSALTDAFVALAKVAHEICGNCKHQENCGDAFRDAPDCILMNFKRMSQRSSDLNMLSDRILKYQKKS
jgi:hypothetical protein